MYSYLKQTKMSSFSFYIIGKQEGRIDPVWGRAGTSRKGEDVGKGCRRVNVVPILCTHVCKWKMRLTKTIPRMWGGGIKENDRGDEFKYDIFATL
jgi:hypothetical protein